MCTQLCFDTNLVLAEKFWILPSYLFQLIFYVGNPFYILFTSMVFTRSIYNIYCTYCYLIFVPTFALLALFFVFIIFLFILVDKILYSFFCYCRWCQLSFLNFFPPQFEWLIVEVLCKPKSWARKKCVQVVTAQES